MFLPIRLHCEVDPCVKYSAARKIWIYLHRARSVDELDRAHAAGEGAARKGRGEGTRKGRKGKGAKLVAKVIIVKLSYAKALRAFV